MKKAALLFLALAVAGVASAAPASPQLRAGAATSNITPPIGSLRVGGFAPFPTVHVHDELHARCLVLDDGQTKLALVVCDLLGLHRSVSLEARRLIEAATGIPSSNVMISATHTHSAANAMGQTRLVSDQTLDEYQSFVARRIADGVQRAHTLLRPAEIAFGTAEAPEHMLNRRWFVREGTGTPNHFGKVDLVRKTSSAKDPNLTEPAGPIDPTISFIALREPAGRMISVYAAYSLHYAGDSGQAHISADYFGYFCEELKRLQGPADQDPPFVALMANATSGDINTNHDNFRAKSKATPYQRTRHIGIDVAGKVQAALGTVTWQDKATLAARFRELGIRWRTVEPELLVWAKDIEAKAPRLSSGDVPIAAKWPTTPNFVAPLSYAGRVQILAKAEQPAKVPVQVLKIGDVCIGSMPCETFAEIGLEFKKRSPFRQSFMVELNHGYIGYLPTPRHFALGGYETWPGTNYLEPQASVTMLDAVLEMAADLKRDERHTAAAK